MSKNIKKLLKHLVLISCALCVFVFTFKNRLSPSELLIISGSSSSIATTNNQLPLSTPPQSTVAAIIKGPDATIDETFDSIYKSKVWGVGSGPGSYAANTAEYRAMLQKIFDDDRYQSFVDFGCGDFQIMKLMRVPQHKSYTGIDVVADVIKENERLYGGNRNLNYKFYHVENLDAFDRELHLLKGDMLIVKDVLQHLSNQNVQYFVNNILPNYKYALITNDYSTTMNNNADIVKGQHRTLDLAAPPFNLTNLQVQLEYKNLGSPKQVYIFTSAN